MTKRVMHVSGGFRGRNGVVWWTALVLTAGEFLLTGAIEEPEAGISGSPCQTYRGNEGTCELVSCPTLHHDLQTLPSPSFLARHGPNCKVDLDGRKLFCCPKKTETRSCGKSTLTDFSNSGVAQASSWPWLALLYTSHENGTLDELGWTGCDGVLVTERHVITFVDCGYVYDGLRILLGAFSDDPGDQQVMKVATSIRPLSWQDIDGLIIMVMAQEATLKSNVVWPICLSLDPVRDLGYKLDNLGSLDKNLAIMPLWKNGPIRKLHQLQVLYLNCTAFNQTYFPVEKTLCATGLSSHECTSVSTGHGTPMVVQSKITEEVYLAGIARSFTCYSPEESYLLSMVGITPYVEDIYSILQLKL